VKAPEGARLDDALDMFHNDSWRDVNRPDIAVEQLAHLLVVLEPWFREEFGPRRKPVTASQERQPTRPNAKVDKGSQHQGRTLVAARSGGLCEICALAPAREWHHRKNRSQGGTWAASNGMHLCIADHAWITGHPAQATRNGWTVRSHEDPAVTRCYRRGLWVLLKDDGSVELMSEVA